MRHATTLPTVPGTIASRRPFLRRSVVIGAAILVIGSVLAWRCGDDDAEYPTGGALRLTDGAVAWSLRSSDEAYRRVIGTSEDVVLIEKRGSGSRRTIAFDAADGSERWRRATRETPTPPGPIDGQGIVVLAVRDARALVQDADALVGVDVVTGEEHWLVESSDVPLANSPTVAVVWDVAGSGGDASGFRGIDRSTGDELWVSDILLSIPSGDFVGRSPAAVLDEVMAVPTGATVTAIDMRTGAVLWQAPQLDYLAAADGVIVGKRGTNEPGNWITLTALDAATGQERCAAPQQLFYYGDLAVGDGVIVILDNFGFPVLVAYELASGNERWRVSLTRSFAPQHISGTSLVMRGDRELAVRSTTDGATIWSATEPFGSAETIPPQVISVDSNGAVVFIAIDSMPAACAPRCD